VVHSRDHKAVGVAHEIISPKNQPQFSQKTIEQYWLGKTMPKYPWKLTQNAFKNLLQKFKNNLSEFLTDCLMPSVKHNSTIRQKLII